MRAFTIVLLALAVPAHGEDLGRLHTFQNWVVGCDNTRRCEAQGYGSEGDDAPPGGRAALWVRRAAGPGQAPVLGIRFSFMEGAQPGPEAGQVLTLQAGSFRLQLPPLTKEALEPEVPAAHVPALLAAVQKAAVLRLSAGKAQWSVSLAGAAAALLKMDDLQQRVGTPGALVRRGTASEVPAPPVPVVTAARVPPTTAADQRLAGAIAAALPRSADDCPDHDPANPNLGLARISATELVVTQACFRGAYQTGSRLWRVADRPPHRATAVPLPQPDGSVEDSAVIDGFGGDAPRLVLHESAKGRGIGDCWVSRDWVWTGTGFALFTASESPCRLFEAGGLSIELWRATVR